MSSNAIIRKSIQKIALHGIYNFKTNAVNGIGQITGYVVGINTEGDLAGTINVQEYINTAHSNEDVGYHEGVYLSAIQDNQNGLLIVPKLYSDVVIVRDPITNVEYVTMVSHVDVIQLDSHDSITIGVREREDFDPNSEDGDDINELQETGVYSRTQYAKSSIIHTVQGDDEADKAYEALTEKDFKVVVGDDKTALTMTQDEASIVHDKSSSKINKDAIEHKVGSSSVTVEDGTVHLGNKTNTDDAVLGGELADILCDLLGYISQIQTTTQLGPQPPLNIASFIALKAKITAFKNSHSGFLTQKVKVQK